MAENTILSLKEYKNAVDEITQRIGNLEDGTKEYKGLLDQTVGTLDSNIKLLAQQKSQLEDLKKQYKEGSISLETYMKGERELKVSMSDLNKQINVQQKLANGAKGSYNDLSQTLSLLKNAFKQLNETEKASDGGKQLAADIQTLDEYLKMTAGGFGEFQRNVGNYEGATISLKAQLKELQSQMAQMLANGAKPTDEAFVKLAQDAGKIKDALNDASAATKQYANDTKGMAAVLDVAQTGVAMFGAWKSTMSLFGAESEEATKVIQTMTTVTTLLNSVQAINKALFDNSTVTYRLFHKALQAIGLEQKAVAASTNATTVATKGLRTALISTGIGAIVVALGTLAANWDSVSKAIKNFISNQNDANKSMNQSPIDRAISNNEELKKSYADLSIELTNNVSEFNKLADAYANANTSFEKNDSLEKAASMMKQYGIECNSVGEAQKLITDKREEVVKAIEAQGKAALMTAIRTKVYVEQWTKLYEHAIKIGATPQNAVNMATSDMKDIEKSLTSTLHSLDSMIDEYTKEYNNIMSNLGQTGKGSLNTKDKKDSEKAETEAQKKRAGVVADLVKTQETLNKSLEESLNLERQLNEIDNRLSKNDKAQLEVDAIEMQIKAQKELLKITKEAEKDTQLSENKRRDYKQKSADIELQITTLKNTIEIQIEKNRIAEEERLRNKSLEDIENNNKKIIDIRENFWSEEKQRISEQYLDGEITYKEYQDRMSQADRDSYIQRLEDEQKFLENKLRYYTDNFNRIVEEGIDPETEAYKNALKEREEALRNFNKATQTLNEERVKNDVALRKRNDEDDKKSWNTKTKNAQKYLNSLNNLFGVVTDILQEDIENRKNKSEEDRKIAEKEFRTLKAFQISQAIISTISGGIGAFMGTWKDETIQPIWLRGILAGVNTAAVLGAGAAEIQKISNTQFDSNGSNVANASNTISTGVSVMPLLNEQADSSTLQAIQTDTMLQNQESKDSRVYILEKDIQDSGNRVNVREKNTTF